MSKPTTEELDALKFGRILHKRPYARRRLPRDGEQTAGRDMKPLKPGQLVTERIEELEAEIERLRFELAEERATISAARVEAAAFLDGLANRLDAYRDQYPAHIRPAAADCREMAARLRGEI